jgi:arylsulfatase A-like enzyme
MSKVRNVIIIVVDALRAKNLGCYGYPAKTSPNIDKFSQESVLFKKAYACSSRTDPSFTSIATGLYPTAHGITEHANRVSEEKTKKAYSIPSLAEVLRSTGYKTYGLDFLSRWHKKGFDYYLGLEGGPKAKKSKLIDFLRETFNIKPGTLQQKILSKTPLYRLFLKLLFNKRSSPYLAADKLVDKAIDILDKGQEKKFVFLHFWDTHRPYWPPDKYLEDFDYTKIYPEAEKPLKEIKKTICSPLGKFFFDQMAFGKKTAKELIKSYDAGIRFVDQEIGRLNEYLSDDDLIIFTADHGESLTEHNIYFGHEGLYDQVLHIPFMVKAPGLKPEVISESFIQPPDIMPMVLEFMDQGVLPSNSRDKCFALNDTEVRKEASVFDKKYKLIVSLDKNFKCEHCGQKHSRDKELYDLTQDPDELNNIAEQAKNTVEEYQGCLNYFLNKSCQPEEAKEISWSKQEENEIAERLKDLGYF